MKGIFYVFFNYLWTLIPHCGTLHKVNQGFKKSQYTIYKEAYRLASLLTGYLAIIFENTSKTVHNDVYTFQHYFTVENLSYKANVCLFKLCYIEIGYGKEV